LIAAGLLFGDIFAVFILHPNNARIGAALASAADAVAKGNPAEVQAAFATIGKLLENRGTKVDAHVHIIAFGYLALMLALVQPWVGLSEKAKKRWAQVFLMGAVMLPVCVFLIYYVGLEWSPLESIGWASIFADFGGLLVIIATAAILYGIARRDRAVTVEDSMLRDRSWSARALLSGGVLLILLGFLHGGWYAYFHLDDHQQREPRILQQLADNAAANQMEGVRASLERYGELAASRAVAIAAHSHVIEFGLMAILLAFVQPYVFLSERWRRRWTLTLLAGSVILPVFVQAEIWWGLAAGAIADIGGLLVLIALIGMLVGVLRYTGRLDPREGA
jgi:heme/copper-type cytochrome/quinol oxidase subunit 4